MRKWSLHLATGAGLALAAVLAACSDGTPGAFSPFAQKPTLSTAPFSCGVTYTTIHSIYDQDLASYGMPEQTDTSRVCESWTGSDYRIYVQRTGSSEPPSEVSDNMQIVLYEYGQTTPLYPDNTAMAEPSQVGADGFSFGFATAEERQASYNDPYYGVYQSGEPEPCPGNPSAIICDDSGGPMYNRSPAGVNLSVSSSGSEGAAQSRNPDADKVGRKEHGLKRKALRALLAASDEIERSPEGYRRFRSARNGEETVITVDPATELMVRQEVKSSLGHTKAELEWKRRGDKYVRERMMIRGVDIMDGRQRESRIVVLISYLKIGRQP